MKIHKQGHHRTSAPPPPIPRPAYPREFPPVAPSWPVGPRLPAQATTTPLSVSANRYERSVYFRLPYVRNQLAEVTGAGVEFKVKKGKDHFTVSLVFTAVKRRRRKKRWRRWITSEPEPSGLAPEAMVELKVSLFQLPVALSAWFSRKFDAQIRVQRRSALVYQVRVFLRA